jgi:hypothetical protein
VALCNRLHGLLAPVLAFIFYVIRDQGLGKDEQNRRTPYYLTVEHRQMVCILPKGNEAIGFNFAVLHPYLVLTKNVYIDSIKKQFFCQEMAAKPTEGFPFFR